jgi:hypothetical protein
MKWFSARLQESSSWPSFGLIGLGIEQITVGEYGMATASILTGIVGFIKPEGGKNDATK